jgi:hypothetical protein
MSTVRVRGNNSIADLERLTQDVTQLAAHLDNCPAGLVPGNEGRSRSQMALPSVRIRTAQCGRVHANQH